MSENKLSIIDQITNRVKALFSETTEEKETTTEMAEATVKDTGIIVKAESWEEGKTVTTVTEEGDEIAMPGGPYELENGTMLVLDENGVITEVVVAEVVEEEAKDEETKEEMSYVTKEEFTASMSEVLKALERVSTKLSATPKEEAPAEKIEAENKLLKQRLAEKRKSVADKSTDKKDILPENFGKTDRGHRSGVKDAVSKKFADFDFKVTKTKEQIDLN